jgi:hypothetical protein
MLFKHFRTKFVMHYTEAKSVGLSSFFVSEIIKVISIELDMGFQIKIYLFSI